MGTTWNNMEQHGAHREIRLLPAMHVHFCQPLRVSAKLYTGITAFPYRLPKIAKTKNHRNKWDYLDILVFG